MRALALLMNWSSMPCDPSSKNVPAMKLFTEKYRAEPKNQSLSFLIGPPSVPV